MEISGPAYIGDEYNPKRVDPFTAVPGAVPFSDFLQAENLRRPGVVPAVAEGEPRDRFEPSQELRESSYPALGDVSPASPGSTGGEPDHHASGDIRDVFRVHGPTGRLLDLVI